MVLGVNLAALPADEREAARLTPEAAQRLMVELDEIFPGTEAAVVADASRTELFVRSSFNPDSITAFLCQRYFDRVAPETPSTHPLGLRYQLNGLQVAQRLLQISAGLHEPGQAGDHLAPVTVAATSPAAEPESRVGLLFRAAGRVTDRTHRARNSLSLAQEEDPAGDAANDAVEPELRRTLTRVTETIVAEELQRLVAELEELTPAAGNQVPARPWPEALQLTHRPHLPPDRMATREEISEVALWSARGLLHDCAQYLGLEPTTPAKDEGVASSRPARD